MIIYFKNKLVLFYFLSYITNIREYNNLEKEEERNISKCQ